MTHAFPLGRIKIRIQRTTTIVKSVVKVAFFTSCFPSSPQGWPNVHQNVNVCARNCSVVSQHGIGGTGKFSKRENSLFSGLKWTTVQLMLYNLPNYFCLWLSENSGCGPKKSKIDDFLSVETSYYC